MIDVSAFISPTKYKRKVDLKKLKFIYNAIKDYCEISSTSCNALKILEVGCGDGSITLPLSAFGGSVTSFDIDDNLVAGVKKEIDKRNISNVDLTRENAYYFSSKESFNIIVVSEVLEHLTHPEKVVANMKAHLIKGGYCIVTVPNGYGPWEMSNKVKKVFSPRRGRESECGHQHVQFFTMSRIVGLFSDNGLELSRFGKSDVLTGVSDVVARTPVIANGDVLLADLLPSWLVSGWYFVFGHKMGNERK